MLLILSKFLQPNSDRDESISAARKALPLKYNYNILK
jgi:hypothetical protein